MTAPPPWLTARDGSLNPGLTPNTLFVVLAGQRQYRLDVRPAGGKFCCNVTQTANGKRFDGPANFDTADTAFAGGLDALRGQLGW